LTVKNEEFTCDIAGYNKKILGWRLIEKRWKFA